MLVTGSRSAQRVITNAVNNHGVTELFALLHTEMSVANFDRFSDENDDGDTQKESMSNEGCRATLIE